MIHNFITHVRWSFEQSNLVKSNIFTCKLSALVIFLILFTRLLCDNSNSFTEGGKVQHFHVPDVWLYISCRLGFEVFWKNSSYVSGLVVCIFVALWLCRFVALYVRMFVAGADKAEGTMSWCVRTNEILASNS